MFNETSAARALSVTFLVGPGRYWVMPCSQEQRGRWPSHRDLETQGKETMKDFPKNGLLLNHQFLNLVLNSRLLVVFRDLKS